MAYISKIALPSGDTYDLKDTRLSLQDILYNSTWEVGSINANGVNTDSTSRIRTINYINIEAASLAVTVDSGYRAAVLWFPVENSCIRDDYWLTGDNVLTAPDGARRIRIVMEAVPSGTASLDYANHISIYVANSDNIDSFRSHPLETGADLDTIYKSGWYTMTYSGSYTNAPNSSSGSRLLFVYSLNGNQASYRFQLFINMTTAQTYMRVRTGGTSGTYGNWVLQNPQPATADIVAAVIAALPIYDGTVT